MADPQSVTLQFSPDGEGGDFAGDLSAVAQIGADLWIGTDEGPAWHGSLRGILTSRVTPRSRSSAASSYPAATMRVLADRFPL
jgi:hypothetical protein